MLVEMGDGDLISGVSNIIYEVLPLAHHEIIYIVIYLAHALYHK